MGYVIFRGLLVCIGTLIAWALVIAAASSLFMHKAEHLAWAQYEWLWVLPGCLIAFWWVYKTIMETNGERRWSRLGRSWRRGLMVRGKEW
jgi:hypothetical protein